MNLFTQQKQTRRLTEQTHGYPSRKGGRDKLGIRDEHIHTFTKRPAVIYSSDLLYNTGNSA